MAAIGDIFRQVGQALKGKPEAQPGAPAVPGQPAMPTPPAKGFDFNLYLQAVQLFGKDFFGNKVPAFFKNPGPYLKNFPTWWKQQKQDEQAAYGGVVLGFVMIIVAVVLFIII